MRRASASAYIVLALPFHILATAFSWAAMEDSLAFEDQVVNLLDEALQSLPKKLESLPSKMGSVAFYTLHSDRKIINPILARNLQSRIEMAFIKAGKPQLVYVPELKPFKVISRENRFSVTSGIRSLAELQELGKKLDVDGIMEGEINVNRAAIYLTLRVVGTEKGELVWSEDFRSKNAMAGNRDTFVTDLGIGLFGLQLTDQGRDPSALATAQIATVPAYANYQAIEVRFTEANPKIKSVKFALALGSHVLGSAAKSTTASFISGKTGDIFLGSVYVRSSVIVGLVPNKEFSDRHWLSAVLSAGRILALGAPDLTEVGFGLESQLSSHFSMGANISLAPAKETTLSATKVKMGGIAYSFFLVRYRFAEE
ncbi:MAG: hypothetical protein HY547_02720 [Elusimicrobia bacterium]|nr:hypothetical protein [Elusimicrobiota bacterium]